MDEKITLEIHYDRGNGQFGCVMTKEIDGNKNSQEFGGDYFTLLRSITSLVGIALEDMADEG